MKKYAYWIFVCIVIGSGIYLMALSAKQPQSEPVIKFSVLEKADDLGVVILKKLRAEVVAAPVIFLGVTPNQAEDLEVWKAFLAANQGAGSKYDLVIMEAQLPFADLINPDLRLDIKNERPRLMEGIKNAREKNLRVAVIAPSMYTSQLMQLNPVGLIQAETKLLITSLSINKYPVTMEQEAAFEPPCSVDNEDRVGTGPLGCAIRTRARGLYRKKVESGKYSAMMDKTGPRDYLILLNRH